ncbi:MAG TPA: glycosyltransferase family 1 protein [Ruminococcaceae bacterium]|nr:glycosyltransferase family 1 protein [Oscillospiraceae bacterium]
MFIRIPKRNPKPRKKRLPRRSEMSKILFISNVTNRITSFATASIAASHNLGLEFFQAANWRDTDPEFIRSEEKKYDIKINNFCISRNPFASSNLTAYREIVDLIKRENIDFIHCNTPTGGILGRMAGKKCGVKKVIYQAHGFHFYQGAPKKNWAVYYPIEKMLARYTDAIITINKEDYELAKKNFRLRGNGSVYYVPGVGIDLSQFEINKKIRAEKRAELGLSDTDFVIISVGELNGNKNNAVIISAMEKLRKDNVHYVLCGVGDRQDELQRSADGAGLHGNVHFLGYRKDVKELYQAADCFVMPSFREGLSRSVMEAMASGLPCVVSKIRGNTDLIEDGRGGFLLAPTDADGFASAIERLCGDRALCDEMSRYNLEKIKEFDVSVVEDGLTKIYKNTL